MFKERDISEEEALKRACKENGLECVAKDKRIPRKTITLVDEEGKETVLDDKFNVVIEANNCTLYQDGSTLFKYGFYSKGNRMIPFSSCEEADKYMNKNMQQIKQI